MRCLYNLSKSRIRIDMAMHRCKKKNTSFYYSPDQWTYEC